MRSALGVSPDAFERAVAVLGEEDAAIVVAAILQRGTEIRSAGGYLRVLTEKARAGEFFPQDPSSWLLLAEGPKKTACKGQVA